MEKKYYEGIDGTNIPYLEFLSKRGDIKKNIIIIHGMENIFIDTKSSLNFYLLMDTMFMC